ncbi:MAG: hypothetical protein ACJ744_07455 [Gaiellaceae bacterium]|jgi:hypothetical protein
MSSPDPRSDLGTHQSFVDWDELSGLDRVVAIHQAGPNILRVDTRDSREIRITAWFDRHAGRYVAEFEKRTAITSGGQQLRVWAQTPAYAKCVADDLVSCLEAAILEVDRPVY